MPRKSKKTSSEPVFTHGAQALIPQNSDLATVSDIKIGKDDMINILSVGITESVQAELDTRKEEKDEVSRLIDIHLERLKKEHLSQAKKEKHLANLSGCRVEFHRYYDYTQQEYKRNLQVHIFTSSDQLKFKPKLANSNVTLYRREEEYTYNCAIPASLKKLLDQQKEIKDKVTDLEEKLAKVSKPSYIKAQLNLRLISSTKNGSVVSENLMNQVKEITKSLIS